MDVARVAEPGCRRCHHRRHAACVALRPGRPPLAGDGSGDRHMPGGRRPLGPANGGRDRGQGIGYPEDKGGSV